MRAFIHCGVLVSAMTAWFAASSWTAAQDAKKDDAKKEEAKKDAKKGEKKEPASAAQELYPQPTEVHRELIKSEEGTWDTTMKAYIAGPTAEPQVFKGVETNKSIADGLWLHSEFESEFLAGKKFKGEGHTGYDTRKKKLVGVWVDNMSTYISQMEGDYDMKTNTVTWSVEHPDPMTGKTVKDKHVAQYKGDGHKIYTIYIQVPQAGAEPVKVVEIESKRRKPDGAKNGETNKEDKK